MAHPPSGRAVSTDVTEPFLVISIRCTKGNFLYRLIDDQPFCLIFNHPQTVSRYVQHRAYRPPPRVLQEFRIEKKNDRLDFKFLFFFVEIERKYIDERDKRENLQLVLS